MISLSMQDGLDSGAQVERLGVERKLIHSNRKKVLVHHKVDNVVATCGSLLWLSLIFRKIEIKVIR